MARPELDQIARGGRDGAGIDEPEPDAADVALVGETRRVELHHERTGSEPGGRGPGRRRVGGLDRLDHRHACRAEQPERLRLTEGPPGRRSPFIVGRPIVMTVERPVAGKRRPRRSSGSAREARSAARLPPCPARDRPLRLHGTAQERDPAGAIEQRLDLRRRLPARERDEHGQHVGPIARGVDERLAHRDRDADLARQRPVREVVDDPKDVIGIRLGEGAHDRRIADGLVGGAPGVDRVADIAHRRQLPKDGLPGGLGDRREVEPGLDGEVGEQRCLAGRDRHESRPAATDPSAEAVAAGVELGRLEQLVEVGAADHPGRGQGGIGHPVLARDRAAVGDRGRLGLRRPPDLDREDRLAELQGSVGQRQEALGPFEPLDEQDDRVGLWILERVGQVVAHVEDDLGAAPDDPAEPDPRAGVDERIRDRPALGDAGHAAARQPRVHVADVDGRLRRPVDDAHAVRTDDRQAVAEGDGPDIALHLGSGLTTFDHAAAGDEHGAGADVGRLLGDRRRPERVQCDEDGVGHLGQRSEVGVARLPPGVGVLRVDEVTAGRAAHDRQVVADRLREVRARRRADHGDRARGEQRPKIDIGPMPRIARAAVTRWFVGVDHPWPTTRPTPRFSRARAMTSRWISLVPSQIRSTRSSRKNRSAANSRM